MTFAKVLVVFLALILCTPAALARDVFFDAQNPNHQLHALLAPYCVQMRKQVEQVWDKVDPRTGGQVQMILVVGPDGQLKNVLPRLLEPSPLIERAVYAVTQCGDFRPLPSGQNGLCIVATFKSRKMLSGPDRKLITDAVIAAALVGVAGFAIFAILKWGGSGSNGMSNAYGATNPGYHWVRGYTRSDGVYVPAHIQTNPNDTLWDNYSTRGNTNWYTGQNGWITP